MAEQPIKSSEIIENDIFKNAIDQSQELINKLKELQVQQVQNLTVSKEYIASYSGKGSKALAELSKETVKVTATLEEYEKTQLGLIEIEKQQAKLKADLAIAAREEARLAKVVNNETKNSESIYAKINKKLNDTRKEYRDLAIQKEVNRKLDEAEERRLNVLEKRIGTYNEALVRVDERMGVHTRKVGNYSSAFDGLGNSVNQLTREMPAFGNSVQTGFMAISNNLPMFFDQIKKIKDENAALALEGKKGASVLTQLGGAIFSWGTALSLGVTLLTLYGKQLVEWVSTLGDAEKALESVTQAELEYGKSINKTTEDIADLKIQIKVKTGLINKETGDILLNENARKKALNDTKELRKKSLEDLVKETGVTQELLANDGKKRLVITQGGEQRENNVLSYFEQKKVDRYKEGLKREKDLMIIENARINEYYNLKAKLIEIDDDGTKKEKKNKETIIDLNDRIIRQNIENETNTKQRAINLANDIERITIKEIEKLNATEKQKQLLILSVKQDTINKLIEIDDKYAKIEQDKIISESNKKIELKERDIAAAEKMVIDGKEYQLFLLEEQYQNEKKLGDKANKKKLEDLQNQILEEKKLLIQARADDEIYRAKTDLEKESIQKKADIEKNKLRKDELKNDRDKELKEAISFSTKVIDIIAKEEAKKSQLRVDAFDKSIKDQEKNIETQRKLAEKGAQNTLVEEEANKVKLERQKEIEKQQEIKRQKALAFFKLFASYADKDPNTALQKALRDTVIAEAVSGAFIDGTENVERDLKGNKVHNGTDGYVIAVDGRERILNPEQNEKVGNLSNEALADLAYKHNNGLLESAKFGVMQTNTFADNIKNSALLMETVALRKEMQDIKQAIKSRPISNFQFDGYGDFIKTTIEDGFKKTTRYKQNKPRI